MTWADFIYTDHFNCNGFLLSFFKKICYLIKERVIWEDSKLDFAIALAQFNKIYENIHLLLRSTNEIDFAIALAEFN